MANKKNTKVSLPGGVFTVAPGVWGMKDMIVNFYLIQDLESDNWMVVDTGLKWSGGKIKKVAACLFGKESKPTGIVLTHGHFDHVGSVAKLSEYWDVPVYAHHMEIPYLTGKSSYPPPDPTVGGGMMASAAFMYPNSPINIWQHLRVLPSDESIPGLAGWKYLHTPGHTPGHVSLFRELDKVLVVGDAFVTMKQESVISILTNKKEISGPPKYFTTDWEASEASVRKLAYLHPATAASGHGAPMRGRELKVALEHLMNHFNEEAIPPQGRYIHEPAVADANGTVYIPQKQARENNDLVWKAFGVSAVIALGFVLKSLKNYKRKRRYNQNMIEIEYNF